MWTIQFFNERVQKDINKWPVGIYADFLRITGLMGRAWGRFKDAHRKSIEERIV